MTTVEPDEQGKTAPIEQPAQASPASPYSAPPAATPAPEPRDAGQAAEPPLTAQPTTAIPSLIEQPASGVVRAASPHQQDVVFVPLAVNVGDGFKFGCGFFLAFVLAMLVGFVVLAALFALTSLFGLNLPITR